MANEPVCNCNALSVPHVHDSSGIRILKESEQSKPKETKNGFTTVAKG